MKQKLWNVAACWSMALMMFTTTLIIIRWAVDFVTWSTMDSGWAQFAGSVLAMVVAFKIGSKQGKDAIAAIVYGYDLATRRKYEAYANIAKAAKEHCERTLDAYPEGVIGSLQLKLFQLDNKRHRLIGALEGIPVYDLGVFDAQDALHELRISMGHLNAAIEKASVHMGGFNGVLPANVPYPTEVIRLCCTNAIRHASAMIVELERPFATQQSATY